jgi:hypothetical protein
MTQRNVSINKGNCSMGMTDKLRPCVIAIN